VVYGGRVGADRIAPWPHSLNHQHHHSSNHHHHHHHRSTTTKAVGASERVLEHLEDAPAPQIAAGEVPKAGFSGRVELRDVGFRCARSLRRAIGVGRLEEAA